ncbi:hypothetical protein AWM70_03215 [Paenibacillus yonginensis]|uniref:DUF3383 family protein n=1 Tax=Paenibacillus yonginensis TaxID=1462996 RepID=A0A1B1MX00_9BACL|nr:DUF3383 family protein [Paenibacillus yonginensis]ANS73704.1 hypothetical protein AWM70_03215 [Paenibacillus yonginensis]
MSQIKDVNVIIDIKRPTPLIGFGKPLILGTSAAGLDYTSFASLTEVSAVYPAGTEEYKAASAVFAQVNRPEELAIMQRKTDEPWTDFMAKVLEKDFYFLISTSTAEEDVLAIAQAVEEHDSRQFFTRSSDLEAVKAVQAKKFLNTTVFYHTDVDSYPEAALIGEAGSKAVGSITWKGQPLQGIEPLDITADELRAIHQAGAITFVIKAGDAVTSEGMTSGGEYIDIVHAKHYVVYSIEFEVQKLFNTAYDHKIAYDNTGIAQIEGTVRGVLQRCLTQGIIAKDDSGKGLYSTSFPGREALTAAQRQTRKYDSGSFEFELAGAVHEATITGLVTY